MRSEVIKNRFSGRLSPFCGQWLYHVGKPVRTPDNAFFLNIAANTAVSRGWSREKNKSRSISLPLRRMLREQYVKITAENSGKAILASGTEANCFRMLQKEVCRIV